MSLFAYVFAGRNGLDHAHTRVHVVRIPEVSLRVREAQKILDGLELPHLDLLNYIASEDDTFLRNIQLKSLAAAIVQVGLYDRARKLPVYRPQILVGNVNGDSALATVIGRQSFEEMVRGSAAVETLRSDTERLVVVRPELPAAPLLSGVSLVEYETVEWREEGGSFETLQSGDMDIAKLFRSLVEARGVRGFVNIGPSGLASRELWDTEDLEVVDSIELDPMLNWFWREVRPEAWAFAT